MWWTTWLTDLERSKFSIKKLAPRWSAPALIKEVLTNQVTYKVEMADGSQRTVHISRLLPLQQDLWGDTFPQGKTMTESVKPPAKSVEDDEPMITEVTLLIPQSPGVNENCKPPRRAPTTTMTKPDVRVNVTPARVTTLEPAKQNNVDVTPPRLTTPEPLSAEVQQPPPTAAMTEVAPLDVDPNQMYIVEGITGHAYLDGRKYFKVRWRDYPGTWVPRKQLREDVPGLVREYEREQRLRGGTRLDYGQ